MSSPPADAAAGEPLALLLHAPNRDAIGLLLSAAFRARHAPEALAAHAALAAFALPPADAARLAAAALELVRRMLYESSEAVAPAAVDARLPPGLDAPLRKHLAQVRRRGRE